MKLLHNDNKGVNSLRSAWKGLRTGLSRVLLLSPADERISYKKTLCLSIEKGKIAVAFGSRFLSGIKIRGVKEYPFPEPEYPPPEFLTSSLSLAGAELRAEGGRLILSLPKAWAVVRTVDYPVSVLENISSVIAFELDRITPFTPENAYYDFRILKEEEGRVYIAVAAVRADLIEPYLKAVQEKGYKVDQITINLLSLVTLCRYIQKMDHVLYVGIDGTQYEGIRYLSNIDLKVFSGSFPAGDEKYIIEQIYQEVEPSLFTSGNIPKLEKDVFYLANKGLLLKGWLKARMGRPVQFLDEFDLKFGPLAKGKNHIPYAAVGGVLESLWIKAIGLNLMLKGVHKKARPPLVITILLALALAVLLGFYWITPIEIEKKILQNIENQIAEKKVETKKIEGLKKEIASVNDEVNLINNFKKSKPLDLDILKELTLVIPKNSWLTRVRVTESQVNIEGYSPSATALIPKLEVSKLFKKVEFSAPTFRDPRQNMDRFQIKMEIEGPADEKK